jgi:hypothetical protein
MRLVPVLRAVSVLCVAAACADQPVAGPRSLGRSGPAFSASADEAPSDVLASMNASLRAAGVSNVAIDRAELLLDKTAFAGGAAPATTILANDRTHLFSSQFVPSDPRRGGGSEIHYLVDQSDGRALSFDPAGAVVILANTVTEPVIDASMQTWRDAPRCGAPDITKVADDGTDPDLVDGLVFGIPALIGTPKADITFAGWLPADFFNAIATNGANFILGVTLTFTFTDDEGNPTDIDHDRRADAAFREIYFNRSFPWGTDGRPVNVDIQSVVVHEAGHAYGLAHFGKIFLDNQGVLKFAPRAIMNAGYTSPFRTLTGTDNASFCQAWANAH